jgi:hypothetical protein
MGNADFKEKWVSLSLPVCAKKNILLENEVRKISA